MSTNKDGMRLAEVVKSSDHEEGQRIAFTLKSVIIDQDDGYGDPVTAPVMVEEQAPTTAKAAKRAVKIPKNATLALNALRDAVADCGQRVANAHVPAGVKVVTLDQWRDYAYRRGLGGEEAKSRQKAFIRATESRRKQPRRHLGALRMAGVKETRLGDSLETKGTGSKVPCSVCPFCLFCPPRRPMGQMSLLSLLLFCLLQRGGEAA